jgi:predicted membrane protein
MNSEEKGSFRVGRVEDGKHVVHGVLARGITGRLVVGVVVIALGIIVLLNELESANAEQVLRWWPALALVWGLMMLTGFCCRRHVTAGLIVSFFAGWLLLMRAGVIERSPWVLWPLVIVILGASLVIAALRGPASAAKLEEGASALRAFALWSGSTRKIVSEDFRGGEITAIMGGHDIDLRPAKIASGPAVIDVFVWWGGVDLRVPPDWKVSNEALALLGGVEDKTRAPEGEAKGHVVIKGLIVMGGVEIRN